MNSVNVTTPYMWADGQTVSCYVYRTPDKVKFFTMSLRKCVDKYPEMRPTEAIKEYAKSKFNKTEE